MKKLENYFYESSKVIQSLNSEIKKLNTISELMLKTIQRNNKILIAGNGGSFADSEHFVGELTCTFNNKKRKGLPAISLGSNPTALTAWSNDFNFYSYYERQVEALANKGDLLFLISTGGNINKTTSSLNLYLSLKKAKKIGCKVVSLIGKSGGNLKKYSDHFILVKSDQTSIIQEAHICLIHYLCYLIDKNVKN